MIRTQINLENKIYFEEGWEHYSEIWPKKEAFWEKRQEIGNP